MADKKRPAQRTQSRKEMVTVNAPFSQPDATSLLTAAVPMYGARTVNESCERILESLSACAQAGAEVVVFPETATDSYQCRPEENRADIERWLPELVAATARAAGPWVILGTYTYADARHANSALVIDPEGKVRGTYDKMSEGGARWLMLDIKGIRCTVTICADFWVPGILTIPKMLGARVCLYPHGSGGVTADRRDWSPLYYTRAWESEMYLVMADCSWPAGEPFERPATVAYPDDFEHHHLNQSCIISPEPRYLARAGRDGADHERPADTKRPSEDPLFARLEIRSGPQFCAPERYPIRDAWQAMLDYCREQGHIEWISS